MLTQTVLIDVIRVLNDRTKKQEVLWTFRNGAYTLDLPNSSRIELRGYTEEGRRACDLLVIRDGHQLLGEMKVSENDDLFREMEELAQGADRAVSIFVSRHILHFLNKEGPIGQPAPSFVMFSGHGTSSGNLTISGEGDMLAPLPIIPMPPRPTLEDAKRFFARIKGAWTLDYTYGNEVATIDENGIYRTSGAMKNGEPYQTTYQLKLLATNQDMSKVEIAKDLNGVRRHIEVLQIADNEMTGVAKHGEFSLTYRKLNGTMGGMEPIKISHHGPWQG
jgi:hypothetical protein